MNKYIRLLFLCFIVSVFICSCTIEHSSEPEPTVTNYLWEIGTISSVGLNDSLINRGVSVAGLTGFVNSVLIIKNGKLVSTNYFNASNSNTIHDIKSVTKSYISAFVGIAIDKGLFTLDSKLTDFFPTIKAHAPDPRINNITVRHLLTMTSGLKSDLQIYPDIAITDFTEYILSFPLDNDPGTFYRYSDSGAYLLSALITKASGQNTFEFANNYFFSLLGYELQGWVKTAAGVPIGGSTMMFTPKNMAVLGLLYLNGGRLNGKQIVSADWVNTSTTDKVHWTNEEMGAIKKLGYGYLWWTGEVNGRTIYTAQGYAGQFIFCIPDTDMVIAVTSDNDVYSTMASEQSLKVLDIISQYFIPAIK
jgi:CubicO group peptidase (beta-lactamase class C family)